MKNIEVTEEMYNSLIELATEMCEQDPLCTRMPHLFQIRDYKMVYNENSFDYICYIDYDDYTVIENAEELIEYLNDMGIQRPSDEIIKNCFKNPNTETFEFEDSEYCTLNDFLEEKTGLSQTGFSYEEVYSNSFLTYKAAKQHLDANKHHYSSKADVYLNHAWRNPEMDLVSTFLCSLIGKKMYQ